MARGVLARGSWAVAGVAAWLALGPGDAGAQEVHDVPRGYACPACRVTMHPVATLRGDGPAAQPMVAARVVRDGLGRYFVGPVVEPGRIAVFGPDGRFLGTVGRRGGGPGELERLNAMAVGPGDSLHVLHDYGRVSVFTPELEFARTWRFDGFRHSPGPAAVRPDGALVTLRSGGSSGTAAHPIRAFEPGDTEGHGWGTPTEAVATYLALLLTGEQVWAAARERFELERFTQDGRHAATYRVRTPWYPPPAERPEARGSERPRLSHLSESERGRIWVLGYVPTPPDSAAPRPPAGAEGRPRMLSLEGWGERRSARLELFDPATGRLHTGGRLATRIVGGLLPGGGLYTFEPIEANDAAIQIWQLRVRER